MNDLDLMLEEKKVLRIQLQQMQDLDESSGSQLNPRQIDELKLNIRMAEARLTELDQIIDEVSRKKANPDDQEE
ncbi:hypothetical protein [Desulfomonile tiedjei]|uniref:Uncharacterized protein n=1 Tax=Desulfomonile tiedjei (strain ATCC 49306 / DSM 6799 / DCB-1) TaxID=706587 RepID=I4C306_DESTA|nr:hypothetical protein [Desulfomonile tiedjei]AFM23947.1 hypothetical protein Desti_1234 [Desulfomonile tiedjei DSM 6799]